MRYSRIKDFVLGKPLHNDQLSHEKLNVLWGLPVLSSDAISSVAYAMEEIMIALTAGALIGLNAYKYAPFVAIPILILLVTLVFSYTQIINHYPSGGGSYIVSSDNFGKNAALLAGVALVVDYIMTVAVSVSASTQALIAALPWTMPYRLMISLASVILITLLNLRGIRESSRIFGVPTYVFIFSMGIMIIVGFLKLITGNLTPIDPSVYANTLNSYSNDVFILIYLKAFASGCSALTGVEAVSNAIPNFRPPAQKNARHVLYLLGITIFFIFSGTSLLANYLHVAPLDGMTVTSQLGQAVFGRNIMFYILQFSTSFILLLATNTAYNDLPIVLSILAKDSFMPRQFSHRGTKLSFSNGIMFLMVVSCLLLIVFKSDTHRLIPFYAVGVFISFTMSQTGMIVKWTRLKEKGWQGRLLINALGALITLVGLVVVFYFKFKDGAWALLIVIPSAMFIMHKIKKHYEKVERQIAVDDDEIVDICHKPPLEMNDPCIIMIRGLNKASIKTINYAQTISNDLTALHIVDSEENETRFREQWKKLCQNNIKLEVIQAPFRDKLIPLDEYIEKRQKELKDNQKLTVIMTKFVESNLLNKLLHDQTPYFFEKHLSQFRKVVIVNVPYIYEKG
ncbi:MAG: APC family permease [Oscillospiraceae bacterium]|nr:APC family permease [Oscillospiraceae bacterium]